MIDRKIFLHLLILYYTKNYIIEMIKHGYQKRGKDS